MPGVSVNRSNIPPNHSGRIRYATPQELPSYPSTGLKEDGAAAGAAASLGWDRQKPVELWKPSASSSAGAAAALGWANQNSIEPWKPTSSSSAAVAAHLANDYKMPPIRETQRSSAPYQAATLAAASASSALNHPRQAPVSTWGNSAANLAFEGANSALHHPPQNTQNAQSMELSRQQSLRAANGAVAGSRPRSISTPQKYGYPDEANASANALNAATAANRHSRAKFDEAGSVPYTNMAREMFTSHPPVKIEVEEKQHADSLHASAVAMAKQMYVQQQKAMDQAKNTDASTAAARSSSFSRHRDGLSPVSSNEGVPTGFPNLQEAAYRLAQERLAKLHEEHQKDRGYQDYYGSPQRNPGRLGSVRQKLTRRRSSSEGDLVDDRQRSQQIRQEMSMFNTTLSKVDEEKRTRARQALLAAAQRNVKAQMEGMDQKMYEATGRVPPSRLNEWEVKAHSAALLRVGAATNENEGKIDLGAGQFMTQEEINVIAAKRVQPILDDINRKAEAERERQLAAKLDEEHRKEGAEIEKSREKEIQGIHKTLKDQQKDEEKRIKAEAKAAEKARKEQEKAAKAEEKRRAKEEKHKSKEAAKPVGPELKERVAEEDHHEDHSEESGLRAEEAQTQTAELIAPVVLPVAVAPVEDTPPVAAEATPAEIEASKAQKEEEKSTKAAEKEEKRKSKVLKKPLALDLRRKSAAKVDTPPATAPLERPETAESPTTTTSAVPKNRSQSFSGGKESDSPPLEDEPRSPGNKIKTWFSSRFARPRTKSTSSPTSSDSKPTSPDTAPGFIGGAALRRRTDSTAESAGSAATSVRDVAFASVGRDTAHKAKGREASPARSVSSLSSSGSSSEEEVEGEQDVSFVDAREEAAASPIDIARTLTPPARMGDPAVVARLSVSPGRGSRFSEIID